ncbi:IS110 family transposase, partial [Paenibacillus elgii]|uniref:IS110 family transposase n=1 Tax=Paenibacillus elgii TaxID=189691 RepID=UPI00203C62E4
MKFKQSDKQNQRIEKITADHLVIGIDIAKFSHVARAVDFRGIERGHYLAFSNDHTGFKNLFQWIQTIMDQHHKTKVLIGVEPTGHYWLNLAFWLQERQLELVLVNPFHVKRNKENRDNSPTKNDVKDALVIADMVKNGYYSEVRMLPESYQEIRQLVHAREFILKQSGAVKNQIHRWVDMHFPELGLVFKDVTCKTALATLALFPLPSDIRDLSPTFIVSQWKKKLKRASLSAAKALIESAKRSTGLPGCPMSSKVCVRLLITQLDFFQQQLAELEEKLGIQIQLIPTTSSLRTFKGISDMTLATLYSEAGDLRQFQHGSQLLRLAGLHLSENSSGLRKGEVTISKRGRPGLRRILFLTVLHLVAANPEFKALHEHNKYVKKMKGMQSLMKLCGKLARILVALAKDNQTYLP